jgi:hypothetical protein
MTWQPIEGAPKDGTKVDLWAEERVVDAKWLNSDWFFWCVYGKEWLRVLPFYANPTHWMPLPEPPTD